MCRMLLSIKPEFVEEILCGNKKYEYRRVRCKEKIDGILIYATAPISQIVAEVSVLGIIEDSIYSVWNETKEFSGISKTYYMQYFSGKEKAVAYCLGEVKEFKKPKDLKEYGLTYAPQSFAYIT